jgi:hypothetical protein
MCKCKMIPILNYKRYHYKFIFTINVPVAVD